MRAVRGEGGEKEWLRCVNRRSHPGHRLSLLTHSSPPRLAQTSICFGPGFCHSILYIWLRGDEMSKFYPIHVFKGRHQI